MPSLLLNELQSLSYVSLIITSIHILTHFLSLFAFLHRTDREHFRFQWKGKMSETLEFVKRKYSH